jgi:4-hydroxy-tetrahydrodipicolinate synthase
MLERLVADVPNIIAIKAEGAMPSLGGLIDVHRRLKDDVVISCPLEKDIIPLMAVMKFQYSGAGNFEYYGDVMPRMSKAAKSGDMDAAMQLYWQIHPARQANAAVNSAAVGALFLNRMMWKFQGWLNGMNGGPLRQPTMKMSDADMAILRRGAEAAGLNPTKEPNSAFFVGRNPG